MAFIKGQPFKPQFDDGSGNLLNAGTIEFQNWDTSAAVNYYTDSGGTSGGTSLTLNSRGEPPNDIFLDSNIKYKFILKDSAGSTISTLGPYQPVASTSTSTTRNVEYQLGSDASSKVFTLANAYTLGVENLRVERNGVGLRRGSSFDYTETSTTSITLTFTPLDNDVFAFIINDSTTSTVADASGITYTPAGTGAQATNVQAKLRGLYVTPQDFGAVGDGVTDDSAAIQAALDANVGTVYFPSGTYLVTTTLVLDYNHSLVLIGASRRNTTIKSATDDIFDVGSVNDAGFFRISELYIKSETGGGHCFNVLYATGTSMWKIENCKIENNNTGKSLWNQTVGYSGGGIVENCHLVAAVGATVNPWYVNAGQIINGWTFKDIRADNSGTTKQFFHIDTTNASSFITNIRFENITFELTNGGMIFCGGAKHVLIENCGSYDLSTTQTGHGIWIGQAGGGLNSQRVTIRNVQKSPISGYAIGVGIQDIKLDSCQSFFIDNADSNTGATLIDYGNSKGIHLNTPSSPTYANDSYVLKIIGDTITLPGDITAQSFRHETSDVEWDVGSGSPEGVETAEPGSLYSRSTPSGGQAAYVKLTGSGNTGWNILPCMEFRTSTQIQDATDTINTSGKAEGRVVYDTTLQKILFATAGLSTSTWANFNGTVEHTPS